MTALMLSRSLKVFWMRCGRLLRCIIMFQGNRLHWTVQCALHDMTIEAMVEPLKRSLTRLQANRTVRSNLHVDDKTLARILLKGSEAVIHGAEETDAASFLSEKMCSNLLEFWKIIITY